jgi:hypothetical protein
MRYNLRCETNVFSSSGIELDSTCDKDVCITEVVISTRIEVVAKREEDESTCHTRQLDVL